jgi:hypothetical protein
MRQVGPASSLLHPTWLSSMGPQGSVWKPLASDSRLDSQHFRICMRASDAPVQLMYGGRSCSRTADRGR